MIFIRRPLWLGAFFAISAISAFAQGKPQAPDPAQGSVNSAGKFVPAAPAPAAEETPQTPEEWKAAAAKLIEKTGEHTFRVGAVSCDRETKTLTIPAKVNARSGILEYALVTRQGKVHEALLSTDAKPLHVQIAALLLGISPQPGAGKAREVTMEVEWATNGPLRAVPLEDLISLAKGNPQAETTATMPHGPWSYTGSQVDAAGFAASREGSLIALIGDPAALVENPRASQPDDSLFVPNTAALPADGVPLSVRIRLKSAPAKP